MMPTAVDGQVQRLNTNALKQDDKTCLFKAPLPIVLSLTQLFLYRFPVMRFGDRLCGCQGCKTSPNLSLQRRGTGRGTLVD